MSALLDIIAAMIIGSVLMITTNRTLEQNAREFSNHNTDAVVQSDLSTMTQILQNDLRKIGYGIPEALQATIIQRAESSRITFLTKQNPAITTPDTVDYSISPFDTVTVIDTSIVLYGVTRRYAASGRSPVITQIGTIASPGVFRYLDQIGRETAERLSVRMVEITLRSLNPSVYLDNATLAARNPTERSRALQQLISQSFWRQTRVVSRNLRR